MNQPRTTGQNATLACLLEAAAPKVGNVHRGADFSNLTFYDFCSAAVAIAPAIERANEVGVGETVCAAVKATQAFATSNVNLGIVLLLAPLAAADRRQPLSTQTVGEVLAALTPTDATGVYAGIQLARPGGMGKVDNMDVAHDAPANLLDAMAAAAERDTVALQYTTQFELVLDELLPLLCDNCLRWGIIRGIVHTQIVCMSRRLDSLIRRKCGDEVAHAAQTQAGAILESGAPDSEPYEQRLKDFDFWLRSDNHRRNPGTTADIIAAALFAGLRDNRIAWTGRW